MSSLFAHEQRHRRQHVARLVALLGRGKSAAEAQRAEAVRGGGVHDRGAHREVAQETSTGDASRRCSCGNSTEPACRTLADPAGSLTRFTQRLRFSVRTTSRAWCPRASSPRGSISPSQVQVWQLVTPKGAGVSVSHGARCCAEEKRTRRGDATVVDRAAKGQIAAGLRPSESVRSQERFGPSAYLRLLACPPCLGLV